MLQKFTFIMLQNMFIMLQKFTFIMLQNMFIMLHIDILMYKRCDNVQTFTF